jgi:hypothetical protein
MHRFQKWRDALQMAPSQKAVVGVIANYIAALPADVWDVLPPECVSMLRSSADIQTAAVCLVQAELDFQGPPESAAIVHEVAHTFAVAAVRITALHGAVLPTGD